MSVEEDYILHKLYPGTTPDNPSDADADIVKAKADKHGIIKTQSEVKQAIKDQDKRYKDKSKAVDALIKTVEYISTDVSTECTVTLEDDSTVVETFTSMNADMHDVTQAENWLIQVARTRIAEEQGL